MAATRPMKAVKAMRYTVNAILDGEPVLLDEAKERVHALPGDQSDDIYTLQPMITAAREYDAQIALVRFSLEKS